MNRITHILASAAAIVATTFVLQSCSLINDDSDCVDSANWFEFAYTRNLKFADAFDHEVKSVTLLAFDSATGLLEYAEKANRGQMNGNSLDVRMRPGKYDILVWAGDYDRHYTIPSATVGKSRIEDFECIVNANSGSCKEPLEHLFHTLERNVELNYASPSNPGHHKFDLTKNTNSIRVMLHQQHDDGESAKPISENDFDFEITDRNGHLTHENLIHPTSDKSELSYKPWIITKGETEYNPNLKTPSRAGVINVIVAEFTINRLFADNQTMLNVTRKSDGKLLFSFPLIDYALMVQSENHRNMDTQEYLDRQDDYALTFILDKNQNWLSVSININGWRLVRFNESLS